MQRTNGAVRWLLGIAVLVSVASVAVAQAPATYVLGTYESAFVFDGVYVDNSTAEQAVYVVEARDMALGIRAAFKEANDAGGVHGRMFEHRHLEWPFQLQDIPGLIADLSARVAANPDLLALGGLQFNTAIAGAIVTQQLGMPDIGTVTPDPNAFNATQSRHMIHTRLPFDIDSLMIARYAVQSRLRCRRTAILYYWEPETNGVVDLATRLYNEFVQLNYHDTPVPVPVDFTNMTKFLTEASAAIRPDTMFQRSQCIAVLQDTQGLMSTLSLLQTIMNVSEYAILSPSVVRSSDWRSVPGFDQGFYNNLYAVSQYPDPMDTRYELSNRYRAAVDALRATGYPVHTTASVQGGSRAVAQQQWQHSFVALEGYLIARLFIEMVRVTSPTGITRASLIDSVYRQKMFFLDDFPMGYFNERCSGRDRELSLVSCECNSGTRRLFMTKANLTTGTTQQLYDDRTNFEVGVSEMHIAASKCSIAEVFSSVDHKSPAIHVMTKDPALPWQVRRISERAQSNMYESVQVIRTIGFGGDVDLDIVLANPPPEFALVPSVFDQVLPNVIKAQAFAAIALANGSLAKGITGVLNFAPLEYRAAVKPDPLVPFEQWNAFYVPMFPTLQDFAVTALEHAVAGPRGPGRVHVIGDTAAEVAMLRKVAHHHQQDPATAAVLFGSTAEATAEVAAGSAEATRIDGALAAAFGAAADGDTVVVAVQNERALSSIIARHAGEHAGVQVVLATSEFVLFSTVVNISLAEGVTSAPANVLYGTGLPYHGSSDYAFADPAEYYTAAIASIAYLAAGTLESLGTDNSAEAYAASFYSSRMIGPGFADVLAGPFVNRSCRLTETVEDHPETECQCNRALNTFYLRSLSDYFGVVYNVYGAGANMTAAYRLATRRERFSFSLSGCGYEFEALRIPPPDTTVRDALISAASICAVLSCVACVVFKIATRGRRDNSCAPKDASKPFAMVFTDIQASTTLWARAPAHMGPAVDQHHALIRELIPKHRGYEVKTIGDSFMVAFQEAKDAVEFALGLQTVLYEADWGTGVFDETYKELIAEAEAIRLAELPQQNAPSNAHVPGMILQPAARSPGVPPERRTKGFSYFDGADPDEPKPYDHSVWQGLRVRVGVHYGLGDIKLDPVSQGYDYYGTVVNTAARVEGVAHGGQVVVTAAVYDALTKDGTESFDVADAAVDEFGPCPLRGLDEPVRLYQVLPSRFKARTYPPLRLDIENDPNAAEDDSDAGRESTVASDVASQHSAASSVAGGTYTYDDLVAWLARRERDPKLRDNLARRVRMGKIMLETLLSTSTPKYKEQAIQHLVEQWRIGELKKDPKLRKFKRHMDAAELNITLLAMRVSNAAESRRAEDPSADGAAEGLGETRSLRVSDVSPQPLSPV